MKIITKMVLGVSLLANGVALSMLIQSDDDSIEGVKASTLQIENSQEINEIYETEIQSLLSYTKPSNQPPEPPPAKLKEVRDPNHPEMIMNAAFVTESMVYGNEDARFKIISYADIECPSCRQIHSHLKAVVDYAPDKVHWEYKHFPLSNHNPSAISQAAIVECTFHEKGNQYAWLMLGEFIKHTKGNGAGQANYVAFAEHVRVEPDWLLSCAQNRQYQIEVEKEYRKGMELGVVGTPTLFITDSVTGNMKRLEAFHTAEQISQVLYTMSR